MTEAPTDTRAFFRGECIRKWPKQVSAANWDSMVFDTGGPLLQRVPMMDPLKGTHSHVAGLLNSCETVTALLDALGHDAVEPVADDPGW
jgi:proteasome accessory factor A